MGKVSRDPVGGIAAAVLSYEAAADDLHPLHGAEVARQLSRQAEWLARLLDGSVMYDSKKVRSAATALNTIHSELRTFIRNFENGRIT